MQELSGQAPRSMVARVESLRDLRSWIAEDLGQYDRGPLATLVHEPQVRWLVRLRITEYVLNRSCRPIGLMARWRLQRHSVRLGYTIPPNVFGPGLRLTHWGTIVVTPSARVGPRCSLHPNTVVGVRDGAPVIGADVVISAGSFIEGPITIGDFAFIAPNAVVRSDVRPHDVVGGIPARSLHPDRRPVASVDQGDTGSDLAARLRANSSR